MTCTSAMSYFYFSFVLDCKLKVHMTRWPLRLELWSVSLFLLLFYDVLTHDLSLFCLCVCASLLLRCTSLQQLSECLEKLSDVLVFTLYTDHAYECSCCAFGRRFARRISCDSGQGRSAEDRFKKKRRALMMDTPVIHAA